MNQKLIIVFFCDQNTGAIRSLIERGWSLAETLFPEFNLKIGKCSYGFASEPSKMKSHNLYDFSRSKKRAFQENEKSNLLSANFYSLPESYAQMSFEWLMELQSGSVLEPSVDRIHVGIDTGVIAAAEILKDEVALERLCSKILGALPEARYGIASIIPGEYLPSGYSIGLSGRSPDGYIHDVNAWGDGYGVKFDKLRNVHGYNFLSQGLLDQPIGNTQLKEWIFSGDKQRGVVSKFSDSLFLWKLTQEKHLLESLDWNYAPTVAIRKELQEQKAFAWQDWPKIKR